MYRQNNRMKKIFQPYRNFYIGLMSNVLICVSEKCDFSKIITKKIQNVIKVFPYI